MKKRETVLQAEFWSLSLKGHDPVFVSGDDEAAIEAAKRLVPVFNTRALVMDVEETPAGKRYHLVAWSREKSPDRFVGVDKLYTPGEAADELDRVLADKDAVGKIVSCHRSWEFEGEAQAYRKIAAIPGGNRAFLIRHDYDDLRPLAVKGFRVLAPGEKAYDKTGRQIWPAPKAL